MRTKFPKDQKLCEKVSIWTEISSEVIKRSDLLNYRILFLTKCFLHAVINQSLISTHQNISSVELANHSVKSVSNTVTNRSMSVWSGMRKAKRLQTRKIAKNTEEATEKKDIEVLGRPYRASGCSFREMRGKCAQFMSANIDKIHLKALLMIKRS